MRQSRGTSKRRILKSSTAAIALAAALGFAGGSPADAAEPMPRQILLQADNVVYDTNTGIVSAEGHVEVSDETRTLLADRVIYDPNANRVTASGNVSVQDETGNVAYADEVELTEDLRTGALKGFSALIGETARVAATSGERQGGRYTIAHAAVFTPCTICEDELGGKPLWQIKAARIVHDQMEKELYFESATFEFMGLPILYLPFFSEPDPTVFHKSGFLLPDLGTITGLGSFIKIPYYWSLGPSRDLTVDPFITADGGTVLQTEYRQRWNLGGMWLQGTLGYDDEAQGIPGGDKWLSSLFGSGRTPLGNNWRAGFDVQLASNKTYLKRYELSYLDRLTTDLFADNVTGRSRAAVTGYFFQSLREADVDGEIPLVLPLMEYSYIPEHRVVGGRLRVDSSTLLLSRDKGTDLVRGSADADWRLPYTTSNGQLLTLQAFLRGDFYYVSDARFGVPTASDDDESIGRALGYGMLEWRWPFVSDMALPGTQLVVEPIAQLIAASGGGNPTNLPNEDSPSFEFDITNLFSPIAAPGLDLWVGGPRANVGIRTTAILPTGLIEATFGQEFRFIRDETVPPGLRLSERKSDFVGQLKIDFPPDLSLTHQFNIDPDDGSIRRNEVYLRGRLRNSIIDLGYLKLPPTAADPTLGEQEQVVVDTTIRVYGNWGVFGEARRDLAKGKMLESSIGITYEDECFITFLGYHRRDTATLNLKPSSSVILRLGLKTGFTGG